MAAPLTLETAAEAPGPLETAADAVVTLETGKVMQLLDVTPFVQVPETAGAKNEHDAEFEGAAVEDSELQPFRGRLHHDRLPG